MQKRRHIAWAIVLAIIAILVYLPALLRTDKFYGDAYSYLFLAKGLRSFQYHLIYYRHLKFLPLYPLAIFFVHSLSFGFLNYVFSAKLVTMISLIASSILVFDFVWHYTGNYAIGIMGGGHYCHISNLYLYSREYNF